MCEKQYRILVSKKYYPCLGFFWEVVGFFYFNVNQCVNQGVNMCENFWLFKNNIAKDVNSIEFWFSKKYQRDKDVGVWMFFDIFFQKPWTNTKDWKFFSKDVCWIYVNIFDSIPVFPSIWKNIVSKESCDENL
jgi:acyl carrier protein phosphodiesterase